MSPSTLDLNWLCRIVIISDAVCLVTSVSCAVVRFSFNLQQAQLREITAYNCSIL
jgi:hypothetical protein